MNKITSICLPTGFIANSLHCGLKKSGKNDLALIYSKVPARATCVFTANAIKSAHIQVDKRHLGADRGVQAVIVNSGNANCANGKQGIIDAEDICNNLAKNLGITKEQVLIASTGIIGKKLAADKINKSLPRLVQGLGKDKAKQVALGIMTTDTFPKEISLIFKLNGTEIKIGGIAKGAGMIQPNMATLLSFITTDVNITKTLLKKALIQAVDSSFNSISIDGCMSTNDTVMVLANGLAGNKLIASGTSKEFRTFCRNLELICLELAKMIVKDGEGATKFITIQVKGAQDSKQARLAGLAIANSMLFKTAMFGSNPNWGRIISALGSVFSNLKESKVSVSLNNRMIFNKGRPLNFKRDLIKGREITVLVNLGFGRGVATVYTSDLSIDYVKINARYN